MKRMFITTNVAKLREKIIGSQPDELGIDVLGSNNINILYYNANNKFDSTSTNSNLILIYDKEYVEAISSIDINKKLDYLLHHTTPPLNENYSQFVHKKEGLHERAADFLYKPVFINFIFNEKIPTTDKAEKIIEFLFPSLEIILDKKLNLLHSLLIPSNNLKLDCPEWVELKDAVDRAKDLNIQLDEQAWLDFVEKDIGVNAEKYHNEPFIEDYIKALTKLRDALLSS